jgi:hypothetical protein
MVNDSGQASRWGSMFAPQHLKAPMAVGKSHWQVQAQAEEFKTDKGIWARDQSLRLIEAIVKYKGVFDMDALYRVIMRWLEEREYEVYEELYKHKPPELEIRWWAMCKRTGYIADLIRVWFHGLSLEEVEVMVNGVPKKMYKGKIRVLMWGEVIMDYPDIFGNRKWTTTFEKKLLNFLNNQILRRDIEFREIDRMLYTVWRLQDVVKTQLNMETKGNAYD